MAQTFASKSALNEAIVLISGPFKVTQDFSRLFNYKCVHFIRSAKSRKLVFAIGKDLYSAMLIGRKEWTRGLSDVMRMAEAVPELLL